MHKTCNGRKQGVRGEGQEEEDEWYQRCYEKVEESVDQGTETLILFFYR